MKITVYTTPDCAFSATEKAYLQSHNLPFEEKDVKSNELNLTEMLKVGNNFAGTPVTKIVKDDNAEVVLKGFTQSEFDEALAPKKEVASAPTSAPVPAQTQSPSDQPVVPVAPAMPQTPAMPVAPAMPTMPGAEPAIPPINVVSPAMPATAPAAPAQAAPEVNPLDSILRDLQSKVAQESAAAGTAQQTPAAPSAPQAGTLPSVPDFGAK